MIDFDINEQEYACWLRVSTMNLTYPAAHAPAAVPDLAVHSVELKHVPFLAVVSALINGHGQIRWKQNRVDHIFLKQFKYLNFGNVNDFVFYDYLRVRKWLRTSAGIVFELHNRK